MFQRMEVDCRIVERGDFLASLEATKAKHEPREDARLQANAGARNADEALVNAFDGLPKSRQGSIVPW